eukprot:4459390-Prorocentrum_lima.AAC.1
MKNKSKGYLWRVISTNIKRAKKELQQEMSRTSTWAWPQTQKKSQRAVVGYGSLEEMERNLIPV